MNQSEEHKNNVKCEKKKRSETGKEWANERARTNENDDREKKNTYSPNGWWTELVRGKRRKRDDVKICNIYIIFRLAFPLRRVVLWRLSQTLLAFATPKHTHIHTHTSNVYTDTHKSWLRHWYIQIQIFHSNTPNDTPSNHKQRKMSKISSTRQQSHTMAKM